MINKINVSIVFLSILLLAACNAIPTQTEEYLAIYKRDTAYLSLHIYKNSYHGNLKVKGRGTDLEFGTIRGTIEGDTLIGDFLYKPYKAKLEKRKPFVLLRRDHVLIQGTGLEQVYMGVPYYSPNSIHFDNPKFVFKKYKARN